MKIQVILVVSIINAYGNYAIAQSMKSVSDTPMVYIVNDLKISDSPSNSEFKTTGTGTLGISFKHNYFYGSVGFSVFSNSSDVKSQNSTSVKPFTNNLLLPDNSGTGISSFYGSIGWKSFGDKDIDWGAENIFSLKRIGIFLNWQTNNSTWIKDSLSVPISIMSPGAFATYNLINLKLENEAEDKVFISGFLGLTSRWLGGDFGLQGNSEIRKYFLNLDEDKTLFISTTGGILLELGSFYGKFQGFYTWGKNNLPGFSGYQTIVTIGTNINLNIPSTFIAPTK